MQYDKELVLDTLEQIRDALVVVEKRCLYAKEADDFSDTEEGQEKLDSICMKLIAVGESLKNVDKLTDRKLLAQYSHIKWKEIKGIRDILSHHYFDLDAVVIFDICNDEIIELLVTINQMIEDINLSSPSVTIGSRDAY
jgi:uncharacterized protein with HEPN domain